MPFPDASTARLPHWIAPAAAAVRHYWGAHLHVRIVPDATPCMDWREVLLPAEAEQWSEARRLAILLHEWGHRMISPVSPQRGALWRAAARKASWLSEIQAHSVVNIATDLWVDRFYLHSADWGEVYRAGERESMAEIAAHLAEPTSEEGSKRLRLLRVLEGLYARLLEDCGSEGAASAAVPGPPDEAAGLVEGVWQVACDETRTEAERIAELARLLTPVLPDDPRVVLWWFVHPYTGRERGGGGFSRRDLAAATRAGIAPSEIGEHQAREAKRLRREAERLRMYARIVPAVRAYLGQSRPAGPLGYRPWYPGLPTTQLDVLASLQRSGMLLPAITTLARRHDREGSSRGRSAGRVVLVIDDSGSTSGPVIQREKEAAFAVVAAARHFHDAVGCVVFGTGVTGEIAPTTRYHAVEDLLVSLSGESGCTMLVPALRRAIEMLRGTDAGALLIMTDAEIADLDAVVDMIDSLPLSVRCSAVCFAGDRMTPEGVAMMASHRCEVFMTSPDTAFAEDALRRVYG